ncbi:MAG TPA: hypothetical protein VGA22_07660 [Gemmatimonadales bacterium]
MRTLLENHRLGKHLLDVVELESVRGKVDYIRWINAEVGARLEEEFFAVGAR